MSKVSIRPERTSAPLQEGGEVCGRVAEEHFMSWGGWRDGTRKHEGFLAKASVTACSRCKARWHALQTCKAKCSASGSQITGSFLLFSLQTEARYQGCHGRNTNLKVAQGKAEE